LKRRNYSDHTVKNYLHRLKLFLEWLAVPVEKASSLEVKYYIDFLLEKQLEAHSINSHISSIRGFYNFLLNEKDVRLSNPVTTGMALREPHPLPRHLKDVDVEFFLKSVKKSRDKAIFMLMLRCGLRVEEVANLTLDAIDYQRSQIMYAVRDQKIGLYI